MSWRRLFWILAGTGMALMLTAVAAFLVTQGLDRADQWSSVVQLFVAVLGLGLTATGWSLRRAATAAEPTNSDIYDIELHGEARDFEVGRGPGADPNSGRDIYMFKVLGPAFGWRFGRLGRGRPLTEPADESTPPDPTTYV